jgi:exopolyphosphatase/guanosine-5'-triphosphate,3'-diphosphate pyrophosphatase
MKATIDIGTNSVLLLIGEPLPDGSVRVIEDRAEGTRLGEGLSQSGSISDAAAERTMAVLRDYRKRCSKQGVDEIAAIGTSALRMASNPGIITDAVASTLGFTVDIIPEEREAKLTYLGCSRSFGNDIVVIDIGGGSTEVIGRSPEPGSTELNAVSMPIGSVSLFEDFIKSDPPNHADLMRARERVRLTLETYLDVHTFARPHDRKFVATAGTATTLMAIRLMLDPYDAAVVHGHVLKMPDLRDVMHDLISRPLKLRRNLKGLPAQRADVIITGSLLLHEAMSFLGYADTVISDHGVKWGLFYKKFCTAGDLKSEAGVLKAEV